MLPRSSFSPSCCTWGWACARKQKRVSASLDGKDVWLLRPMRLTCVDAGIMEVTACRAGCAGLPKAAGKN